MKLERGKKEALEMMKQGPIVAEVRDNFIYVGIGYAVAKGWAVYSGDGEFRITTEGVKALAAIQTS